MPMLLTTDLQLGNCASRPYPKKSCWYARQKKKIKRKKKWTAATAQSSPGEEVFPPGAKEEDKVFTEGKGKG